MQKVIQYYRVGGHLFAIEAMPEQLALLSNYTPFIADEKGTGCVFTIHVENDTLPSMSGWEHIYTNSAEDNMPCTQIYRRADEWLFRIAASKENESECVIHCTSDWQDVTLFVCTADTRYAIDTAAMYAYAFRTAGMDTLLFHASVVMRGGKGFLFIGRSGTGKSTHSQQWLQAFEDTELLNDDNPVVRVLEDKSVRVYGSPWSGKTPCYKNKEVPAGGIVQLAQAPCNSIHPLRMSQAYPYILASVSGLKIEPQMMDMLYTSIARLLEYCPVYKLECLPNLEAARLCAQTCLS